MDGVFIWLWLGIYAVLVVARDNLARCDGGQACMTPAASSRGCSSSELTHTMPSVQTMSTAALQQQRNTMPIHAYTHDHTPDKTHAWHFRINHAGYGTHRVEWTQPASCRHAISEQVAMVPPMPSRTSSEQAVGCTPSCAAAKDASQCAELVLVHLRRRGPVVAGARKVLAGCRHSEALRMQKMRSILVHCHRPAPCVLHGRQSWAGRWRRRRGGVV